MKGVAEDIVDYIVRESDYKRNLDVYTEIDLNQYKDRPCSAIVSQRQSPMEPSLTADVDFHGLSVSVVTGIGEKGYTAGARMAEDLYRLLRLVLDVRINDTLYLCIQAVSAPYIVTVTPEERTQYNFELEITRYIGD